MTYQELCEFEVLYNGFLEARKRKTKKPATAQYEAEVLENTQDLSDDLKAKRHRPGKFELFYVYEPKKRLVQAPSFKDKVVLHTITDNVLYDAITRSFIRDNYASQKRKGTHDGLGRLKWAMTDYYRKHGNADGWVLKADVHHFFASIDHDLLKRKLIALFEKRNLDFEILELLFIYIDTTAGLPLGYQTSQLLALLFLDEFDHWVKEKLHAKYYGRYMDDFYIISDSKEFLQGCWRQINGRMDALKLELNEKTAIFPLRNGLNFLGFHTYLDNGGAVIMKLRQDSLDRMKARTRGWRKDKEAGTLDVARTVNRWKAWDAHAAHGDTFELRKQIAAIVSEITGVTCTARPPIRAGKYDKAKEAVRKVNRQRRRPPAPAQQKVPTGFPW